MNKITQQTARKIQQDLCKWLCNKNIHASTAISGEDGNIIIQVQIQKCPPNFTMPSKFKGATLSVIKIKPTHI